MTGLFISFEGIDGSGKSTQARLLAERLKQDGRAVVLTREPGGSPGAEEIRRMVLEGDTDRWSAKTELLLFTAARRDHLERTIRPALAQGDIVITDRFADSSRIYQGLGRAALGDMVDQLHALVIGQEPDLTILVDMDPDTGLKRALGRQGTEERFEDFGVEMQVRMRQGFLDLAAKHSDRFVVINGDQPIEDVQADILKAVLARLL